MREKEEKRKKGGREGTMESWKEGREGGRAKSERRSGPKKGEKKGREAARPSFVPCLPTPSIRPLLPVPPSLPPLPVQPTSVLARTPNPKPTMNGCGRIGHRRHRGGREGATRRAAAMRCHDLARLSRKWEQDRVKRGLSGTLNCSCPHPSIPK